MKKGLGIIGWPGLLWFISFLAVPLFLVVLVSLANRGVYGGLEWTFSMRNYDRLFEPVYAGILWQSLKLSLMTTLICIVLAYPMAWAMATAPIRMRHACVALLAIPFLTNLIIRVYAIRIFVGSGGPLQWLLQNLQIDFDPFAITQNTPLVLFGMVTTYLPFMVFPLFAALDKFDFSQIEAAQDLGAGSRRVFFRVILPGTKYAAYTGCALVFVPTLGEFVIPDLLGGAKNMLIGNLITEQFLKARDWPFGAALSVTMIAVLIAVVTFGVRGMKRAEQNE